MENIFQNTLKTREQFIQLMKGLTIEELNQIPEGFRNNIIWNFGHIVVTTLALCYQRTGLNAELNIPFQGEFGKGTVPQRNYTASDLDEIIELSNSSLNQLQTDFTEGVFRNIQSFSTQTYELELKNIEDVILTCLMHDNLHYGYALAQKKSLKK